MQALGGKMYSGQATASTVTDPNQVNLLRRSQMATDNLPHSLQSLEIVRLRGVLSKMRGRCENPLDRQYKHYGARGVQCLITSPSEIIAAIGIRPTPKHSIDRINNDGNYDVDNIQWATAAEQNNNKQRNRKITFNGETHTVAEWSAKTGISQDTLRYRRLLNWCVECMLTKPVKYWARKRVCTHQTQHLAEAKRMMEGE